MRILSGKNFSRDMTEGPIIRHLILYTIPLFIGSVFQVLYGAADSIILGNFVSVQALAAASATSFITNIFVFFFTGFSTGTSVVIGRAFGAKDGKKVHDAMSTAIAISFLFCAVFTAAGLAFANPILRVFSTPEDVFSDASVYLRIYFAGISGLLLLNICCGILRAMGDTVHPLIFLAASNVLNIVLDLIFVVALKMGIAGAALGTIISQMAAAAALLALISRKDNEYRLQWSDLHVRPDIRKQILDIGLPAGIQSIIGAVSNAVLQRYVNVFGSTVVAGWTGYNVMNNFISIPMNSLAISATIFVSQNLGAGQHKRVRAGIRTSNLLTLGVTAVLCSFVFILANPMIKLFNSTPEVVQYGSLFIKLNVPPLILYSVGHTLTGSMRGLGDSKNVMYMKLAFFIGLRQLYLFFVTKYMFNTPAAVALSVPFSWIIGTVVELIYFKVRWSKRIENGEVSA